MRNLSEPAELTAEDWEAGESAALGDVDEYSDFLAGLAIRNSAVHLPDIRDAVAALAFTDSATGPQLVAMLLSPYQHVVWAGAQKLREMYLQHAQQRVFEVASQHSEEIAKWLAEPPCFEDRRVA